MQAARARVGFSWLVALGAGLFFVAVGAWAIVAPQSFFDSAALFPPYNQHFLQDVGAFQIGLGAVLLVAALDSINDALTAALIGVGLGATAHVVSHAVGTDLGGRPEVDIPILAIIGGLLLAAGIRRRRRLTSGSSS